MDRTRDRMDEWTEDTMETTMDMARAEAAVRSALRAGVEPDSLRIEMRHAMSGGHGLGRVLAAEYSCSIPALAGAAARIAGGVCISGAGA